MKVSTCHIVCVTCRLDGRELMTDNPPLCLKCYNDLVSRKWINEAKRQHCLLSSLYTMIHVTNTPNQLAIDELGKMFRDTGHN